jgi:hypothetical protein
LLQALDSRAGVSRSSVERQPVIINTKQRTEVLTEYQCFIAPHYTADTLDETAHLARIPGILVRFTPAGECIVVVDIRNKDVAWHIAGYAILTGVGLLLRGIYAASGNSPVLAVLGPVNRSVWEQFKPGFWSMVLYMLGEYWFIGKKRKTYFSAKALGLLALQFFILTVFYVYTTFTRAVVPGIDIVGYLLGAIICQFVSFRVLTDEQAPPWGGRIGLSVLVIHLILVVAFTFWTPKRSIFADPQTGDYGIEMRADG